MKRIGRSLTNTIFEPYSEVQMIQTFDGMNFEERLRRLEKQNQQLKLLAKFLLLILTPALLVTCRNEQPSTVKAQQFVLVDASGQTRGDLIVGSDGPALELYDSNKTLRVGLAVLGDMPTLTLKDSAGVGRLVAGIVPTGPGMMLYDQRGRPRAQLDVGKEGPRLYLEDEKGFSATVGNYYYLSDPRANEKVTAASLVLSAPSLGVIWHAP